MTVGATGPTGPSIQIRVIRLDVLPPIRLLARQFQDLPGLAVLDGGPTGVGNGRWSYLTADPYDRVRWTRDGVRSDCLGLMDSDGFKALHTLTVTEYQPTEVLPPFIGGAIGYIAYEAACELEPLSRGRGDQSLTDLMWGGLYDWVVARDGRDGTGWIVATDVGERDPEEACTGVHERLRSTDVPIVTSRTRQGISNVGRPEFGRWVEVVKDYISAGDCYQVNLARRIEFDPVSSGLDHFERLASIHPAPFGAYIEAGELAVVSASPELFLEVDSAGRALTRPIKGTAPRGATKVLDSDAESRLRESFKDRAENLMIVDVLRNDFGRVCVPGSIRVPSLWTTEALPTVWQLVSEVTGCLREGVTATDLLRACWPGGSITGAPKIRAMQIIDEIEPVTRDVYCGSIFALGHDGALMASLAIRTVQLHHKRAYLHVGAGIVADSDPDLEFQETVAKARGVLEALGITEN